MDAFCTCGRIILPNRIGVAPPLPPLLERTQMSNLVVIVYPSEEKAEEVRKKLFELQGEYLIKIGDAVIATKTDKGQVKLHQMMNMTAAGAASGSFWGLLIGVLFLNPILGVAAG